MNEDSVVLPQCVQSPCPSFISLHVQPLNVVFQTYSLSNPNPFLPLVDNVLFIATQHSSVIPLVWLNVCAEIPFKKSDISPPL